MFALLSQRRLRWLGHVSRMDDGRIPKDLLYGELATGLRPTGRPTLRFKDVCKRDMKVGNINLAGWKALAADRSHWRLAVKVGTQACEERREEQWDERRERRRLRAASVQYPQSQARNSSATTATKPADLESDCTATAGAATQPLTKTWR